MSFNVLQLYIFSLMLHVFVYLFFGGWFHLELDAPHVGFDSLKLHFGVLILPLVPNEELIVV